MSHADTNLYGGQPPKAVCPPIIYLNYIWYFNFDAKMKRLSKTDEMQERKEIALYYKKRLRYLESHSDSNQKLRRKPR
jgi:hypothetical protein